MSLEEIVCDAEVHQHAEENDDNPADDREIGAAHAMGKCRIGEQIPAECIGNLRADKEKQRGENIPCDGEHDKCADGCAQTMLVEQSADS